MDITKQNYVWPNIRSQAFRRMVLIVLMAILGLIGWAGMRYLDYQEKAPLRAGISAIKAGDYATALEKIVPFAKAGNILAQEMLGDMYAYGLGVEINDVKARIWYRRAECNCRRR